MKKYLFYLFVILLPKFTISQNFQEPLLTNSFGLNNHTNRDIGMFSHVDSESNIYAIGTTEKDTTFNDVITIKLGVDHKEIWRKRFSLPTNMSYDVPEKTFLSSKGELYIIGRSSFRESKSNGLIFIIKYDKNGNLLFDKTIGNLDGSDYVDYGYMNAELNDDGTLNLVYAPFDYTNYDSELFKFLKIDSIGNIIDSFEKEIPNRGVTGMINNGDYYLFTKKLIDEVNYLYNYELHRITNSVNQSSVEISDSQFVKYFNGAVLSDNVSMTIDSSKNIFLACPNEFGGKFDPFYTHTLQIAKIDVVTGLKYIVSTSESDDYFLIDSFINKNNEHIVVANNLNNNSTEFLTVNDTNEIQTIATKNDFLATGLKTNDDGSFYLTTSNFNLNLFSIDLNFIRTFNTSNTFSLVNFSKIDDNNIIAMGTRFEKMFPESDFETQLDIIVEKISESNVARSYEYSGIGTSLAFQQKVLVDNDNNYIIFATEKLGPQSFFIGSKTAPISNKVYKFDSSLNLIWELEIPKVHSIINSGNIDNLIRIDTNNNIYINVLNNGDDNISNSYALVKISSEGELQYKINSILPLDIIINNNDLYIVSVKIKESSNSPNFYTNVYLINNTTGELEQTYKYPYLTYVAGYTDQNNDLFLYMKNDFNENSKQPKISLYKNNSLVFERKINVSSTRDLYVKHDEIVDDGNLIFSTNSHEISQNNKIHKITTNNEYNFVVNYKKVYGLFVLDNGKIFVRLEDDYSRVYNEDLSLFSLNTSFKLSGTGAYFMKFNNNLLYFRTSDNSLLIFDDYSNIINELKIDSYVGHWYSQQDKDGFLITTGSFGEQIYTYHWYSWRRGYIKKYDLNSVLSADDDREYESNAYDNLVSIYPNPSKDIFKIKLRNSMINQIQLFDVRGNLIRTHSAIDSIDLQNFNSGIYFVKVISTDNNIYSRKIIKE